MVTNGNWGQWAAYTACTKTCGGGSQLRTRNCNNPSPQNGGAECSLSSGGTMLVETESRTCNAQLCAGKAMVCNSYKHSNGASQGGMRILSYENTVQI